MSNDRHRLNAAAGARRRTLGPDAPSLRLPAKPAARPRCVPRRRWWARLAEALCPAPALQPAH